MSETQTGYQRRRPERQIDVARLSIGIENCLRSACHEGEGRLSHRWPSLARLLEKGGKVLEVPCHHNLETYLKDYIEAAGIAPDRDGPLFRSLNRDGSLSGRRLTRQRAWEMLRRRARAAGISADVCNRSFRATGITAYLENPEARVEVAQYLAGHADPKTTKLYDRRTDHVSLDEIERIGI